jgi:hypothetical protein
MGIWTAAVGIVRTGALLQPVNRKIQLLLIRVAKRFGTVKPAPGMVLSYFR